MQQGVVKPIRGIIYVVSFALITSEIKVAIHSILPLGKEIITYQSELKAMSSHM
jgi:hypothetical protein